MGRGTAGSRGFFLLPAPPAALPAVLPTDISSSHNHHRAGGAPPHQRTAQQRPQQPPAPVPGRRWRGAAGSFRPSSPAPLVRQRPSASAVRMLVPRRKTWPPLELNQKSRALAISSCEVWIVSWRLRSRCCWSSSSHLCYPRLSRRRHQDGGAGLGFHQCLWQSRSVGRPRMVGPRERQSSLLSFLLEILAMSLCPPRLAHQVPRVQLALLQRQARRCKQKKTLSPTAKPRAASCNRPAAAFLPVSSFAVVEANEFGGLTFVSVDAHFPFFPQPPEVALQGQSFRREGGDAVRA